MPGDVRSFKSRADNFLDQLIASALSAAPTPETCLICARADLKTALQALRQEPPDVGIARLYLHEALTHLTMAGV